MQQNRKELQNTAWSLWSEYYSRQEYPEQQESLHLGILIIILFDRVGVRSLNEEQLRTLIDKLENKIKNDTGPTLKTKRYLYFNFVASPIYGTAEYSSIGAGRS